jgi:hypothetical protein
LAVKYQYSVSTRTPSWSNKMYFFMASGFPERS